MARPDHHHQPPSTLPQAFIIKKRKILAELSTPVSEYTDKSPKGSIDTPIIELIDEINAVSGLVTTSSCSGRVSVFVEGPRSHDAGNRNGNEKVTEDVAEDDDGGDDDDDDDEDVAEVTTRKPAKVSKGGPGGKGGGKWLYVSHDPPDLSLATQTNGEDNLYFTRLCGLIPPSSIHHPSPTSPHPAPIRTQPPSQDPPQLIHLSFSPLILHILTATLHHARPLLSAAINAGFRESGVQSLAALSDPTVSNKNHNDSSVAGAGTMVAIRTAGLAFDTVIGRVRHVWDENEKKEKEFMEALVSEEYLRMCFGVVGERFGFNEGRKERLRGEIARRFHVDGEDGLGTGGGGVSGEKEGRKDWEGKEERARRKREEGLRRRDEYRKKIDCEGEDQGVGKEVVVDGGGSMLLGLLDP